MVNEPDELRALRDALVREVSRDVSDPRVLEALRAVPRHLFMPGEPLARAYADAPFPIGHGQTISQPAIVAIMTAALELRETDRVLEIGTGSGYQAAILAHLGAEVLSIEVVPELAAEAAARLARLGYANVRVRAGDGYAGWPEKAPFPRILVTAAPETLPAALLQQLADGGVLVTPIGPVHGDQRLVRCRRRGSAIFTEDLGGVRFVPMVPQAAEPGR